VRLASWLAFVLGAVATSAGYAVALDHAPAVLELPLRVLYVVGLGALGLATATLHDLALAALALGPTRSTLRALHAAARAVHTRTLLAHALALGMTLLLTLAADGAGRIAWPLPGSLGPTLSTALAQVCLFGALLVRATWLSRAACSLSSANPRSAALSPPRS
jgi:hypothetical protein